MASRLSPTYSSSSEDSSGGSSLSGSSCSISDSSSSSSSSSSSTCSIDDSSSGGGGGGSTASASGSDTSWGADDDAAVLASFGLPLPLPWCCRVDEIVDLLPQELRASELLCLPELAALAGPEGAEALRGSRIKKMGGCNMEVYRVQVPAVYRVQVECTVPWTGDCVQVSCSVRRSGVLSVCDLSTPSTIEPLRPVL
jgi:hypothetical protein